MQEGGKNPPPWPLSDHHATTVPPPNSKCFQCLCRPGSMMWYSSLHVVVDLTTDLHLAYPCSIQYKLCTVGLVYFIHATVDLKAFVPRPCSAKRVGTRDRFAYECAWTYDIIICILLKLLVRDITLQQDFPNKTDQCIQLSTGAILL